jgi:D-hexose-6-phosphate mutarotase
MLTARGFCRGGVPVCWPQFSDMGSGPPHGFARNSYFQVTEQSASRVVLTLSSDSAKGKLPQEFVLEVTVAISDNHGGLLSQQVRLRTSLLILPTRE